ncbi:hypothetical protein D3C79_1092850 [compost metagenome]
MLERQDAAGNQLTQVEIDVFQLKRSAFDAREVEDIVDDFQQMPGGFAGHGGVVGLFGT